MQTAASISRFRILARLLLVVGATCLGASCASPSGSAPTPEKTLATIHRTGGLLGADQTITYLRDGQYDIRWDSGRDKGRHETGQTPSDTYAKVQQTLEQVDKLTNTDFPAPKPTADAYQFDMQRGGRTFNWNSVNPELPAPLANLSFLFNLTEMLGRARAK